MIAGSAMLAAAGCGVHRSTATTGTPGPSASSLTAGLDAHDAALVQRGFDQLTPCPESAPTAISGGLPNITLSCLGRGPAVHLSGLTGKPTVVNVWASWCTECGTEGPYLTAAYAADKASVRFLGVDTADTAASGLSYGTQFSPVVHYPSVLDPQKKVLLSIPQQGPPATIFLDAAGRKVHVEKGPYSSLSALQHDIATYLHVTT